MTESSDSSVLSALTSTSFVKDNQVIDVAADTAAQVFILDMQESLPGVKRIRDWALDVLAPQPGEVAIDVGCGTGAEVRRMAELVGTSGRAIGIEPHPGLRASAAERSAGTTATYLDGAAADLPFDDSSVDVIRCERVFQHLLDPEAAVAEFARVLAPGGRVVLIDSDWETSVQTPGDPAVLDRLTAFRRSQVPNPTSGRRLRGQLTSAELVVDPDIAATAVIPPPPALTALMTKMCGDAVEAGVISQAESDELLAVTAAAQQSGQAFMAVTMFGVLGRKP
ncbi:MAG: methyltransferase domain-containing protein [Marmoricola sp.]